MLLVSVLVNGCTCSFVDIYSCVICDHLKALCLPFIHTNEHAGDVFSQSDQWLGHLTAKDASQWIDLAFAMVSMAICW